MEAMLPSGSVHCYSLTDFESVNTPGGMNLPEDLFMLSPTVPFPVLSLYHTSHCSAVVVG